eukprot:TRINITY_DN6854_c0_g1_i1.p1 TRINITY_DN6854_c0_g1~~TRINITY_DN6854_c0_g1_i1.p1  ORF type:complete len:1082 (+),score=291.51 TRINITY_DN6854_c0_g1_i1:95-3340(+)
MAQGEARRAVQIAFQYVYKNTLRSNRNFLVGICTVFLVVLFLSFLQNAIQSSPRIFVKLAEGQTGESDLVFLPLVTNTSNQFAINQTLVDQKLTGIPEVIGAAPRWTVLGTVSNPALPGINATCIIVIFNTTREREISLGRAWRRRALGNQEAFLSTGLVTALQMTPNTGQQVIVNFDLSKFLSAGQIANTTFAGGNVTDIFNVTQLINQNPGLGDLLDGLAITDDQVNTFAQQAQSALATGQLATPVKLLDAVDYPDGKWPAALGNVVILEASYAATLLGPLIRLATGASATDFKFSEFAFESHVVYRDRMKAYVKNSDDMNADILRFSDIVGAALGAEFPVTVTAPVLAGLSATGFIRLFLDQIFNMVVIVLVFLGCVLIYSLQIGDVQEKTYEYGMLRALGMRHGMLITLLLFQALFYAVPGILASYIAIAVFNAVLSVMFAQATSNFVDFSVDSAAMGIGLAIGMAMPLMSNIFPIRRALSKTLRDSLDMYHQSVNDVLVQFQSLEHVGLSPAQTALAIMLAIMGFVVYYIVPYAFTYGNFALFLFIFTIILLGMVFGFSLLAQIIQPYFERLLLFVSMWGADRKMHSLVLKHLHGHRNRNRKTAVMFTTSMAFIIFAGSMFALQANSIGDNLRQAFGADITYTAASLDTKLPEPTLTAFLNQQMTLPNPLVIGYSFVSFTLADSGCGVYATRICSLSGFRDRPIDIITLESRYLDVVFNQFFTVTQYDRSLPYRMVNGQPDVVQSLYTSAGRAKLPYEPATGTYVPVPVTTVQNNPGAQGRSKTNATIIYTNYLDVLFSQAMTASQSLVQDLPLRTIIRFNINRQRTAETHYLAKPRAVLSKLAGFFFSSYQLLADDSPVIVSQDQFLRLMQDVDAAVDESQNKFNTVADIPKKQVMIKLRAGNTLAQRIDLMNAINNFIRDSTTAAADTQGAVESTAQATNLMNVFFIIVAFISTVLSFFILWLSFTANIRENSWEFGVLRSLGLTGSQVVRCYVYEALALIISSVILGAAIGMCISITLTLQFNLFTESPFQFAFPTALFVAVVVMSIAVALIGSYIPAQAVTKREIALVIRGL